MDNSILSQLETLLDFVKCAEEQYAKEQGYTQDEVIKLLVKHSLVSDKPDDMD